MLRSFLIIILASLFCFPLFAQKKAPTPAGLDSLTKREADSLSRTLFGEEKAEDRARKEFENGQDDFRAGDAFLNEADSLRRMGVDTTLRKPGGVMGFLKQNFGDSSLTSGERETRKRGEAALKRAVKEFARALELSPQLFEARLWLAATYDRLQEWDKSLEVYRDILNERQGEDRLWFNYGYAALQGGQYEKAVNAFEQAIRISLLVNGDSAKVPNRYRTFAGEAFLKTYQDRLALERFRQAQQYADSAEAAEIQRTIDWILWDDGGIATAEYRDAAYAAERESRWDDARQAYLGGIAAARTQRAKNELSYRLALLEFQHSTRSDGLARMKALVESVPDAPEEYRENYGKMLFSYAQMLEQESDPRGAISYYLQSTKIVWSGQGTGYLEIARLAANDLDRAIEYATKALEFNLTGEQQKTAYRILEESYRAKGNWEMMKRYRQLLEATP
jgi:tetratricopeptide (TPR) repeat protein